MRICPSCGEENSDRARFCQNCATPLTEAERTSEVRKVVTIVFADVTGSTALGERLDPEALRRVMGRYFDEMSAVIERYGGTVEKFIGDAVMAVFGIPQLHEDDALRAVRAADDMRQALESLNHDLERDHGVGLAARIGVNTGEVVAGDPASGQRLVTGDAVNVAARLEQAAAPGQILLGESTHRLVKDAVEITPVEPLDLKGKTKPIPASSLDAVLEDAAGHARHLDSAMVGRHKELEMLDRALDRVLGEGTSHLFTLLGPAGVGKSRLVQEFVAGPGTEATVLRGRCLSYGEGITYFPLVEIVQEATGVERTDDLATARSKLTTLADGAEDRDRIVSLVAGLLSWGEPIAAEDGQWGVRKFLEHLANERPLVCVFDDIHWAEPNFLDLIEHLADWTRDAPLLLLCVARPELLELRPDWGGGKLNATTILLEPLAGDEMSHLVDNLLGRAEIPEDARARILETAEGNPLFVEEMLGMLIDDGLLRFEDGAWRAVEDLAHVTVPPTIQLLLAARLDRLDAEERAVIERGAVEGKVFHAGAVRTLTPETLRPQVPTRLLALARKELIRPDRAEFAGEDAFRFRHLLIRDAAYHAMPKEQRADLHQRFAAWLEGSAGQRVAEYEEILGYHLEQAYRYRGELGPPDEAMKELGRSAATRLTSSAERARERGDFAVAEKLLRGAAEISEGTTRTRSLFELAQTLFEKNDFPASAETARQAIEAAEESGDPVLAQRAALVLDEDLGQIEPTHTLQRTRASAEDALRRLQDLGDDPGIVQATITLSRMAFYHGECTRSLEITDELLDRASELPFTARRMIGLNRAVSGYFGPAPVEEAMRIYDQALAIVPDSIIAQAFLGEIHAALLAMLGREEEFRVEQERVDRLMDEIGLPEVLTNTYQGRGEAERFLGHLDRAEQQFRAGVEQWDALGETGFNSTMTALLAGVLCDLERFDEAEANVNRSRELSAEDDFASQAAWRMAQARVLSHRGEHNEALALADEAVAINQTTDYLTWQGESDEVRGMVLTAAGRTDEALEAYTRALDRFERKGVVPAAARVRARIAELLG
ncbi:MAG TPA: adenylate/guanylate cyclase domain-containing protein [Actinomycetota bacterium]